MVEATWVNVGGVWGIRIVSGSAKPGDQVMVRRRTGSATLHTLGAELAPGVFAKDGKQSAVRQRGRYRSGGYNVARDFATEYYVHESNEPMTPLEAWHASMRGC